MNTALWIVQVLLALAFLAAGGMKLAKPKDELAKDMAWVEDSSPGFVRLVGLLEVVWGRFGDYAF